jgi:glycogen synthase
MNRIYQGGIIASDQITAVSPTYKEEIQYEFFGEKLDGLLCNLIRSNNTAFHKVYVSIKL